tara:strand:+ start:379 stop:558 length:180 start_codon:yes stop_codon:yes gene_type:complete
MKVGEKFTFYSHGTRRKALFLEQNKEIIKAVICDEKMQGINIEINQSRIIMTKNEQAKG